MRWKPECLCEKRMLRNAKGTSIIEFYLAAFPFAMLVGGMLWIVERFFILEQLEFQAARAAIRKLEKNRGVPVHPPCLKIRAELTQGKANASARCGGSIRTARILH